MADLNITVPEPSATGDSTGLQIVLTYDGTNRMITVSYNAPNKAFDPVSFRPLALTAPNRTALQTAVTAIVAEAKQRLGFP
jgi:hypothetical protein